MPSNRSKSLTIKIYVNCTNRPKERKMSQPKKNAHTQFLSHAIALSLYVCVRQCTRNKFASWQTSTVFMFRHFFFIDVSSQRIWWCMCMRHCRFYTCKMLKTSVCISQSTINPFRCHVYINALCMFNTQFLPSHSLTRTHTYVAPLSDWMHLAHLLSCMWCYMLFLSFIQWIFAITFFFSFEFFLCGGITCGEKRI